jgi:hypothetical protein
MAQQEVKLHMCNKIGILICRHFSFIEPYKINIISEIRFQLQIY